MALPSDLTDLYAWYDGAQDLYDATSGGSAVVAGAAIARWEDQSGNARHLTQGTSGNRPKWDGTRNLVVSVLDSNQWMSAPGSFTLDKQDCSMFFIVELSSLRSLYHWLNQASGRSIEMYYENAVTTNNGKLAISNSGTRFSRRPMTSQLCLIGCVFTGSNVKIWIDDTSSTVTALSSGTDTITSFMGFNGFTGPSKGAFKDIIIYDRALSDSEVTDTIFAYAIDRGVASSREHQVVFEGDSITNGFGTALNRGWPSLLSIPATVRRKNYGLTGQYLFRGSAAITDRYANEVELEVVSGETNILCVFAGTNDINDGETGTDTYNELVTHCQAAQADGYLVLVFTMLPRTSFDGTKEGYRTTYNTNVRANWATFADGICDVAADARLDDATDATYFSDGTHPTQAGYTVIAELADTELTALLPAPPPSDPEASDFATNTAGTSITATLSEAGCTPSSGTGGFTLSGTSATVSGWAISSTTLTLTLSGTVTYGQTVTISYDDAGASEAIEDADSNPMADFSGVAVTNNRLPPLVAGTASFVGSGAAGISVEATAPTDGEGAGPTYQWERNEDGGSYSDLTGETSLTCDDDTVTTGILYGYRCKQTRGSETVTTNTVTAEVYEGGAIGGGGSSSIFQSSVIRGV